MPNTENNENHTTHNLEIKKLESLSKLKLSEKAAAALTQDLEKILDFVDTIQAQTTTGIDPLATPLDGMQPGRPDKVTEPTDQRDGFMALAPQSDAGLYIVPAVIEEGN